MSIKTHLDSCDSAWPSLPFSVWSGTQYYLHQISQIIGKLRMINSPWQNHSWHTTLYIVPNGLSTGSIPFKDGVFQIDIDFTKHQIGIFTSFKKDFIVPLPNKSVASIYGSLVRYCKSVGIEHNIYPYPNEIEEQIRFDQNESSEYDPFYAEQFWQVAISCHNVIQQFRVGFVGKSSPIDFFWGAFDIAYTRFSGRDAPLHQGSIPNMPKKVMQEAYSKEVFSIGFWPGSTDFPEALFYTYIYPGKNSFSNRELGGVPAKWNEELGEYVLLYKDLLKLDNPSDALFSFFQQTYEWATTALGWDTKLLHRSI